MLAEPKELGKPCVLCGVAAEDAQETAFIKDGYQITRCRSCGLVRRADIPEPEALARLYELDYFSSGPEGDPAGYLDYLGDEQLHRQSAHARLRLLERFVPRGTLLDVGCAAGFFVDEAQRSGWKARGIDLSEPMATWGRDVLHAPLETSSFGDFQLPPDSLDAITMWDYIEHSSAPVEDIQRAGALLRPGGVLALSTGDIGSLVARLSGRRWHLLTPRHHLFYFDRRTLRLLMSQAGLEVLECRARSSRYSLRHVVFKTRSMVENGPLRVVSSVLDSRRLGTIALPINLWDIVTVIARKPA